MNYPPPFKNGGSAFLDARAQQKIQCPDLKKNKQKLSPPNSKLQTLGFIEVGGYSEMKEKFLSPLAYANISKLDPSNDCGKAPNDSFSLLREPSDDELPWPGFIFGQSIASLWYWATDQVW